MIARILTVLAAVSFAPIALAQAVPAAPAMPDVKAVTADAQKKAVESSATAPKAGTKAESASATEQAKAKAKTTGKEGVAVGATKAEKAGAPAQVTAPAKAKGEVTVDKGVDAAAAKLGDKPAGK
jgi:hypothetical protein